MKDLKNTLHEQPEIEVVHVNADGQHFFNESKAKKRGVTYKSFDREEILGMKELPKIKAGKDEPKGKPLTGAKAGKGKPGPQDDNGGDSDDNAGDSEDPEGDKDPAPDVVLTPGQ